jgi:hypothetical protein
MLLDLDFMPPYQIGHMYLNDLRRLVANMDKNQIGNRMHKPSVALDPEYRVSVIGDPSLSICLPKKHLLEYLQHWGFGQ